MPFPPPILRPVLDALKTLGRDLAGGALDRSIFWSFDRSGFLRHARAFDPAALATDLAGRRVLVTGANAGLGRAAAEELAARGAEVWLLCRSEARGAEALAAIRRASGTRKVHLLVADLADLASLAAIDAALPDAPLDVLVHNAGVLPQHRVTTPDGLELTLATNLIGPFRLTRELLPRLERSTDARVIHVSSGGMYAVRLDLESLEQPPAPFDGVRAYAQTKRAQVILNELLAERHRGSGIAFHAMHPGWASTPGVERSLPRFATLMRSRLRTPAQGADTIVWLAASDAVKFTSGRFWFDRQPAPTHLAPWTRERDADRERLWELCLRLSEAA